MKSFIAIAAIYLGLLLSVQSCLTCTECKRNDLEAKCITPNDTLFFTQSIGRNTPYVHRYYNGGDSLFIYPPGSHGFDKAVQSLTDSGYTCSVYATGHVSEIKRCNQAGEGDDDEYAEMRSFGPAGYTCHEYKGH
jgi:hypothetical protein